MLLILLLLWEVFFIVATGTRIYFIVVAGEIFFCCCYKGAFCYFCCRGGAFFAVAAGECCFAVAAGVCCFAVVGFVLLLSERGIDFFAAAAVGRVFLLLLIFCYCYEELFFYLAIGKDIYLIYIY